MKYSALILLFLNLSLPVFSQNITVQGRVRDAADGEALPGATISVPGLKMGAIAQADGSFSIVLPGSDSVTLVVTFLDYIPATIRFVPDKATPPLDIRLENAGEMEEVLISSTRTNSRIEDLPVKVEVLGAEELEEEVSLVPGGMGSLLGDLSVITIQRTGTVSGNDAVRMQGLAPGYTQLLQDGLPLYGGFSGSLGVLNIPPLDLRQVEIIKGSSSTLYGGGAIGGIINFLSKRPGAEPKSTLLFNQTTLGESDVNAFFSRKVTPSQGFTILAAGTYKKRQDINGDGFSEVPFTRQWALQPRWFFGMGKKANANLGFSYSQNRLRAGDMVAVGQNAATGEHPFLQNETGRRMTISGQASGPVCAHATWTLRGAGSAFRRSGYYAGLDFAGRQINSYAEANVWWAWPHDDLVLGANLTGEKFELEKTIPAVPFGSFGDLTSGIFAQLDHRFSKKVALQAGFRTDRHSQYGWFALPRISVLYKPVNNFSARIGYGRGYKTPNLFDAAEPAEFQQLQPLDALVHPDLANSVNADLNFQRLLFDALSIQINQAFYYAGLARPFETVSDTSGHIFLQNAAGNALVLGTDTYLQMTFKKLEFYLGYNHTLSRRERPGLDVLFEPFNPKDKIAATLAWSWHDAWRIGLEAAYTGNQYVYNNRRVPSYWFVAAMIARKFHWGTIVLNCENLGDARQSRHEPLVTGGLLHPVFLPVWGPVEGRVLNLSVKVDW
jgi:iron complex outermembrane receptor protein/outer membrane receptor for ferrienterochelin and colicins